MQDVDEGREEILQRWLYVIGGDRDKATELFDLMWEASQDKSDCERTLDDANDRLHLIPAYAAYLKGYMTDLAIGEEEEAPQTFEEYFENAKPDGYDKPGYRTEYMRKAEDTTAKMAKLVGNLNRLTSTEEGQSALKLYIATGHMLDPIVTCFGDLHNKEMELAQVKGELVAAEAQIVKMAKSWVNVLVSLVPQDEKDAAMLELAGKLHEERTANVNLVAELQQIYHLLALEHAAYEAEDLDGEAAQMQELKFMLDAWEAGQPRLTGELYTIRWPYPDWPDTMEARQMGRILFYTYNRAEATNDRPLMAAVLQTADRMQKYFKRKR